MNAKPMQADEALRESEERYRAVVENQTEMLCRFRPDGTILFANGAYARARGTTPAELMGRNFWEFVAEEDRSAVRAMLDRLTPEAPEVRIENRFETIDGERWILWTNRALTFDADGRLVEAQSAGIDMTERKRAEQLLAEAMRQKEALYYFMERRFRAESLEEIYEAGMDAILSALCCERAAILLLDESEVMRFVAWRRLSEDYRKAVEGHSPWRSEESNPRPVCVPDIAATELDESLKVVVRGEGIGALAFIPLVVNGKLGGKFMTYYNAPHVFSGEELELSLTIARQIALGIERKLDEEKLRESEAKARRLLELNRTTMTNMGEGMYTVDMHGLVTYMNPEAERLFGWKSEDLLGRRIHDVIHYKHPDGSPFPIEECPGFQVLREGKVLKDFEDTFIRKDGSFFPVSYSSSPLRDQNGEILGLVVVFQDITERKRAAEDLARLNLELENKVAERTAALQQANLALLRDMEERKKLQEELLQAQKMQSIGTLAGGIAHDFNNILNIVLGYTLLLKHSTREENLSDALGVIEETVQRGAALAQQLLTIARKTAIKFQGVDIHAILEELKLLLSETFPKTIDIALELHPDLPPLIADPNQIHQALLNLCVNARDAMPNGGKIFLESSIVDGAELSQSFQGAKEERYVSIRVADTGAGIDEVTKSRIFEPFFTTKPQGQGTGLGLSVVYGIIANHSGFLDVESAPGQGTSFHIYLPIPREKVEIMEVQPQPDAKKAKDPAGRGETVLFVDDEEKQLCLMRKFLETEGFRVLTARDGAEAVDMYLGHKEEIAAVILDLGLPKFNGWEALQRMRKIRPELKALFATGFLSPEIEAELARGEISGIIMKPYQLDEVLEKISGVLKIHYRP